MNADDKILITIAETAPIVSAGVSHCLHHLPRLQIHTVEVHTPEDLTDNIVSLQPDIVMINPSSFRNVDVQQLKSLSTDLKLVAIATAPLDRQTLSLFDSSISIADDAQTILEKINALTSGDTPAEDDREVLSQREKEIVALVVKGMTNKEIADKLFLSVHTVMTHRRNIARKLEIHSATGLTIYAIVNHLVDLSEINL